MTTCGLLVNPAQDFTAFVHLGLARYTVKQVAVSSVVQRKQEMNTHRLLIATLAIGLTACTPLVHVSSLSSKTFPPTNEVEILATQVPSRRYVEIAELEVVNEYSRESQFEALKKKAKEVGANAVILVAEANKGAIAVDSWGAYGGSAMVIPVRRIRGIAIRYLD